jgi:hypothetical protein
MAASVPVTELSLAALHPEQRAALIEHGLVWQHEGGLRTHTLVAGMSRTLREQGVSGELITELLLDVAKVGTQLGAVLCGRIRAETVVDARATQAASAQRQADLALLGAQLLATGFEVTCARAATAGGAASRQPRR